MRNEMFNVLEKICLTGTIEVYEILDEPMEDEEVVQEVEQLIIVKTNNSTRYFQLIYVRAMDYCAGHVNEEVDEKRIHEFLNSRGALVLKTDGQFTSESTLQSHVTTIENNDNQFLLALTTKFPYGARYFTKEELQQLEKETIFELIQR